MKRAIPILAATLLATPAAAAGIDDLTFYTEEFPPISTPTKAA